MLNEHLRKMVSLCRQLRDLTQEMAAHTRERNSTGADLERLLDQRQVLIDRLAATNELVAAIKARIMSGQPVDRVDLADFLELLPPNEGTEARRLFRELEQLIGEIRQLDQGNRLALEKNLHDLKDQLTQIASGRRAKAAYNLTEKEAFFVDKKG